MADDKGQDEKAKDLDVKPSVMDRAKARAGKVEDEVKKFVHTRDLPHGEKSDAQKAREEQEKENRENPASLLPAQMVDVDHDAMPDSKPGRGGTAVSGISPDISNASLPEDKQVSGTLPGV